MAKRQADVRGFVRLMLDAAFTGKGWQGPTLAGCLRGLRPHEALRRPGRGRRCIWEHLLHATYWKHAALRAVVSEDLPGLGLSPANWPRVPSTKLPERDLARVWRADVARLRRVHADLLAAVAAMPERDVWAKSSPARRHPRTVYLAGIAAHDVYHAGQIQLIKKLVR